MTHQRPKTDGVGGSGFGNAPIRVSLDAGQDASGNPLGITDLTDAVDAKLTPTAVANEAFSACQIRCEMLHGQWMAECERLRELGGRLKKVTDEEVQRVTRK